MSEISRSFLLKRARAGDAVAREHLLAGMLGLAHHIAADYHLPNGERDDLVQAALVGIDEAITQFQTGGVPFSAYASSVARRRCIDLVRGATRKKRYGGWEASLDDPVPGAEGDEMQLLEVLPAPDRADARLATLESLRALLPFLRGQAIAVFPHLLLAGGPNGDVDYEPIAAATGLTYKQIDNVVQRVRRQAADLAA